MKSKKLLIISALSLLASCTNYNANPQGEYASYNCTQLWQEKAVLNNGLRQANDDQSSNQIYQLGMAALAMANGDSYNTKPDTTKTDHINAQVDELQHEEIRKQCAN